MSSQNVAIGPFVVGEIPAPLIYNFQDSNGAALDFSSGGWTADFIVRETFSQPATLPASIVGGASKGAVQRIWDGTEFPTPGHYIAEFWVGNAVQRLCSWEITFDVRAPVGIIPFI